MEGVSGLQADWSPGKKRRMLRCSGWEIRLEARAQVYKRYKAHRSNSTSEGPMRSKKMCVMLVFLGWCLASGVISCKFFVGNGPVRPEGAKLVSDVMLKVQALGFRLVGAVGQVDVSRVSVGQRIRIPGQHLAKTAVLLGSFFLMMLPAACLTGVFSSPDEAVEAGESSLGDLELGVTQVMRHPVNEEAVKAGERALGR